MPSQPFITAAVELLADQTHNLLLPNQEMDPRSPSYGAIINPAWGIDDPSHVGSSVVLASMCLIVMAEKKRFYSCDTVKVVSRAQAMADYLIRAQRSSGRIDLKDCNYDSGPDTAFCVQLFCAILELAEQTKINNPRWSKLLKTIRAFTAKAASGLLDGGFHTPNHRWVVASGLAQAIPLFPSLKLKALPVLEALRNETIDIDAEGSFIERSVAIYDAVTCRSLLFLNEKAGWPDALQAALQNLRFNLHLFHPDETVETALSRRQDYGTRTVPTALGACYLQAACFSKQDRATFVQKAYNILDAAKRTQRDHTQLSAFWMAWAAIRFGEPRLAHAKPKPVAFSQWYPIKKAWRIRKDQLSATFLGGGTRLASIVSGRAELASIKITQSLLGTGRFVADEIKHSANSILMISHGEMYPNRPGYDLPSGSPVTMEKWDEAIAKRTIRRMVPARSSLKITQIDNGFECKLVSRQCIDGVAVQIALDFAPGAIFRNKSTLFKPVTGSIIFLRHGYASMSYTGDTIEVGPGTSAHSIWTMRDSEPAPHHIRLILALTTPCDHTFFIRTGQSCSTS